MTRETVIVLLVIIAAFSFVSLGARQNTVHARKSKCEMTGGIFLHNASAGHGCYDKDVILKANGKPRQD